MEAMQRAGVADPRDFFALPSPWPELHVLHTRYRIEGRYEPVRDKKGRVVVPPRQSSAQTAAGIQAWRAQRQQPPTPQEVADARACLAIPGLHPDARQAALQTLARAEAA